MKESQQNGLFPLSTTIITMTLLTLKVLGYLKISWWIVFIMFWAPVALFLIGICIALVVFIIIMIYKFSKVIFGK